MNNVAYFIMSYQALYRTYRPKTFSDVIGQEHIVPLLEKAVQTGTVSHAHLFCGGRGTGKTSLARILASALHTDASDMYEIDAASNRGIDDIRLLRDGVNTLPYASKYKVYIIDEVHMLTKEAFNALLKTLEEPPTHVIFILATTDKEKVPDTILSRCQVYSFKNPTVPTLEKVVVHVCAQEGYEIDPSAATLIALLGNGSYRDTFSILEKAILTSQDKKIIRSEVERSVGLPMYTHVIAFVQAYIASDTTKMRTIFEGTQTEGVKAQVFVEEVLRVIRDVLRMRMEGKGGADEYAKALKPLTTEVKLNSKTLETFLQLYGNVYKHPFPELWVETLFL